MQPITRRTQSQGRRHCSVRSRPFTLGLAGSIHAQVAISILKWSVVPVYKLIMSFEDGRLLSQGAEVSLDPKNRPQMFDNMELLMKVRRTVHAFRAAFHFRFDSSTEGANCRVGKSVGSIHGQE